MESLTERLEAGLSLNDPSLETNSPSASPSTEAENWKKFVEFMKLRAAVRPYPKFLYRAHVHGHPFPRFIQEGAYEYADTFSSELHAWTEEECQSEINTFVLPFDSIVDVFQELSRHLQETQICRNDSGYLSSMVSLSGDLRWTTHGLCEVGKKANEDQIPGLAVFDVKKIQETDQIWRVSDMFEFLDNSEELKVATGQNRIEVPEHVQQWSRNAEEYVCWEYVPREALVSFGKLSDLTLSGLLNSNLTTSKHLGDLKRYALEPISLNEYEARASAFLRAAVVVPLCLEKADVESIANQLTPLFHNPFHWGYGVLGFAEDLEDLVAGLRDDLTKIQQKGFLLLLHQKHVLLDYEVALQQIW
ncbi:hypothetical protein BBO_08528 [Beauveria brongniartii RCEF 3172]|uniref:Uncharacterized protein n=1 Tax=Beauveria brongniartii RCEF 3172 TaxID=1081107 RepID=A0A166XJA4_9HYPO|nr:hypothetical protein BBO_08528 [Beauveria brongniartii RCEF 3172]